MAASAAMSVASSKIQTQLKSKEDVRQQEESNQKLWTILSIVVASAAMVTALVAMWWEASLITYLAMAFPFVTSPLVIRRTRKLNKLPSTCSFFLVVVVVFFGH
jgi:predicted PurR-regulated permease PerM